MNISNLKEDYGDEYPAAIVVGGLRMLIHTERRFSRSYRAEDRSMHSEISRFMDGSASITAFELKQQWPTWTDDIRWDFCNSSSWLDDQTDFPEMLRFIVHHGEPHYWPAIALSIASRLPGDEAFETLVMAIRKTEFGRTANFCQAIAYTKHRNAEPTLRKHLAALWEHLGLWDDSDTINWIGFDTTTCIAHLIEAGAPPSDFNEQVRKLSEHICADNRKNCRNFLSKHYPWLN